MKYSLRRDLRTILSYHDLILSRGLAFTSRIQVWQISFPNLVVKADSMTCGILLKAIPKSLFIKSQAWISSSLDDMNFLSSRRFNKANRVRFKNEL